MDVSTTHPQNNYILTESQNVCLITTTKDILIIR